MKSGRRDREIGWPNLLKVSTDLESRSIREKSATDILKSAHSILKATKIIKSQTLILKSGRVIFRNQAFWHLKNEQFDLKKLKIKKIADLEKCSTTIFKKHQTLIFGPISFLFRFNIEDLAFQISLRINSKTPTSTEILSHLTLKTTNH